MSHCAAQPDALQNSCAAVSPSVLHEALEWQVTFWSGEVMDEERDGFDKWLARSPEHARAWSQVQKTDEQFVALARPAASIALRAAAPASLPARTPRRAVLGIAGLLAGTGCAAYMARNTWQWQQIVADIGTGRGERKEVTLADGTRIILGSASAIDVRYDAHQRQLRLRGGQVFITTGADTQANPSGSKRPFIVLTEHGSVRAIGTRFAVRDAGAWAEVAVEQGAVEITPKNQNAGVRQRVNAGERASFRDAGADPVQPLDANATAWIRGLLVAERMRLEDLLAQLGRHRSGVIRCDPAVRDLVVSGVYSLDDTDHALQILTQALPVQLTSVTRWWVIVGPRS